MKKGHVMDKTTAKAIRRLGSRWDWRRRAAAEALTGTEDPQAVEPLIACLKDRNQEVALAAQIALANLRGKAADRFCALWAERRDEWLEVILLKAGYIASTPLELKCLTAFKQRKVLEENIPWNILESCLLDRDMNVVCSAVDYAINTAGRTPEALWAFVLEHPESFVARALLMKGWRPQDVYERALFYFLADDLRAYHDIDFEQAYLRSWYESARPALKEAIASRIRKIGDTRLLAVFRTERGQRKERITEEETEIQAEIMMKNRDFEGLFELLPFCNYELGRRIIAFLKEEGWQSPDPRGQELQKRLEALLSHQQEQSLPPSYAMAIYEDFRPMFLGEHNPPSTEAELQAWLSGSDFRKRSAALITLAEQGSRLLNDAANKACGDPYWQVRMAAAACEVLQPGTLSPANRALLEQDHVVWVAALLKMPRKNRSLFELGPQGLEELKDVGTLLSPDCKPDGPNNFFEILRALVPTAEREYLLTLGEFYGTDVVVSQETAYEAGAADVEIEMEE